MVRLIWCVIACAVLSACAGGASRPVDLTAPGSGEAWAESGRLASDAQSTQRGRGSVLLEYYLPRTVVSFQLAPPASASSSKSQTASAATTQTVNVNVDRGTAELAGAKTAAPTAGGASAAGVAPARQDLARIGVSVTHVADRRARFLFELRHSLLSNTDYDLSVDENGMLDTAFGSSQGALSAALDALGRNTAYTAGSIREYRAALTAETEAEAEVEAEAAGEDAEVEAEANALSSIVAYLDNLPALQEAANRRPSAAGDGFISGDGMTPDPAGHFRFPSEDGEGRSTLSASPAALRRVFGAATEPVMERFNERTNGRCTMAQVINETCTGRILVEVTNPFRSGDTMRRAAVRKVEAAQPLGLCPRNADALAATARCLIPLTSRIVARPLDAAAPEHRNVQDRHWAQAERRYPCEETGGFLLESVEGCRRFAYHASYVPLWLEVEQCLGFEAVCNPQHSHSRRGATNWELVRAIPVFAASESEYLAVDQRSAAWGSNAVVARFEDGRLVRVRHERNTAATEIVTAPFVVINAVLSVPRNLFSGLIAG